MAQRAVPGNAQGARLRATEGASGPSTPTSEGGRKKVVRRSEEKHDIPKRPLAVAHRVITESLPAWLAVGAVVALIFGGCCSNVYALEAIVQVDPGCGTLLTFVQFLFVAITGYVSQFDRTRPPLFLAKNVVPLYRWFINIVLFFSVNILNNHAFSYDISVPVHIILRSGGPITTIAAGWLYGKRYTRTQTVAAVLMTVGVAIAAWSDAQNKDASGDSQAEKAPFGVGVFILFLAMALSACMGLYTEEVYKMYGPQWRENLFYSHLLSLPLFLPFAPGLVRQFDNLARSRPLSMPADLWGMLPEITKPGFLWMKALHVPSQLAYLGLNVLTQYACIRGVNLLAAASSALTVVIVLNIRKLVSLLLSIWLFGNKLSAGTLLGAVVVFAAGGIYSLGGKAKPKTSSGVKRSESKSQ